MEGLVRKWLYRCDTLLYFKELLFKCNKKHIYEYPNLWNFTLELYQHPGVEEITNLSHIKQGYYATMKRLDVKGFVPLGPDLDFTQAHDRERFSNK